MVTCGGSLGTVVSERGGSPYGGTGGDWATGRPFGGGCAARGAVAGTGWLQLSVACFDVAGFTAGTANPAFGCDAG